MKRAIALAIDISLCILAVWLAFYLRLGEFLALNREPRWALVVSIGLAIPIFVVSGLYRAIFRYSGLPAIMLVVRAVATYGIIYVAIFAVIGVPGTPRTIGLIQPLLMLILIGGSRIMAGRWLGGLYRNQLRRTTLPRVLIYGAGDAGRQLMAAMTNSHEMRIVGFIDDDPRLHNQVLNGMPIYSPKEIPDLLNEANISSVLLALPSVSRQRRNEILASLAPLRVAVRTLPGLADMVAGRINVRDLRELDIDDLLAREPVAPNHHLLNLNTQNKTVLVTGAGGSIGSELCRQVLKSRPKKLLLVEMSEFALYQIHQELQSLLKSRHDEMTSEPDEETLTTTPEHADIEIIPLLTSVCDEARMNDIMGTWLPDTVYHAAAYKHVPLVEHNPTEGLHNNVWGTLTCARAAVRHRVNNFVLISTDKAVRPTNVMGASKRLAEMVLQGLATRRSTGSNGTTQTLGHATTFSIVRFGNVLGSSGSVVPLFREQIKTGGPITLTHAEMTRYFMTIPEAAQLVIQAGAMGKGGEVFVLDMGTPVRIYDLARRMIELSGLSVLDPEHDRGDIEIKVTGLRPGEKLYEELLIGSNPQLTEHTRIMRAQEDFLPWDALQDKLQVLALAMSSQDIGMIRDLLSELVHGYQPSEHIVDWVYLAQANARPSAASTYKASV